MMGNIYLSSQAEVLEIKRHTDTEQSFWLRTEIKAMPGQFVIASLPKAGEVPISISGFRPRAIELTIRNAGKATSQISRVNPGGHLYIRGPYGNCFPLEEFANQRLLIIVGGSAIAAAKPLIEYYLGDGTLGLKKLDILAGFKSPRFILFREELNRWKRRCNVVVTVDNDEDYAWMGSTGFVVSFIKNVPDIGEDTKVVLIGPPLMMVNSVRELLGHKVREENIYLSFERHMKCGLGKCGHCRIRDKYVCVDGPVFSYKEAKELID